MGVALGERRSLYRHGKTERIVPLACLLARSITSGVSIKRL